MKKLILILLVFTSLTLTGCTNYSKFNTEKLGDSCIIASKRYVSFNDPNKINTTIYCIDGVQYIRAEGTGISPYIKPEALDGYFENGYRSCSCKEGKE
jgi:uncharacterized lipoprotein NlpE involved in copper resistance